MYRKIRDTNVGVPKPYIHMHIHWNWASLGP
jgi:hypothetical protein